MADEVTERAWAKVGQRADSCNDTTMKALARVIIDLKARVKALEAGQVHTQASDLARAIRAQQGGDR